MILDFLDKWMDGYDVVYGVRTERDGESAFKLWTAKYFYRFIGKLSDTEIPLDTGDFRLMDRRVVDALLAMPERDRFVRGMVSWIGFSQIAAPYRRAARHAGTTKFSLIEDDALCDGRHRLVLDSAAASRHLGGLRGLRGCASGNFGGDHRANRWHPGLVKGWASLVIAVLFLGGVQLICMGIIGEYVGRIYGESKRRPLYVVRERMGFEVQNRGVAEKLRPRNMVAER